MMLDLLKEEYELGVSGGSTVKREQGLPLTRACATLEVTRADLYRSLGASADEDEMALRESIQAIALEMPGYGYRRIWHTLLRQGWIVNHKRVLRLMRADNLLCLRRRKFVICTTDSNHPFPIYPNLAADLTVTGMNQLWVADITYVRLQREFIYLGVVLDVFSRRCIGWALARHMRAELPQAALEMALRQRADTTDLTQLVHHSDRGSQYASHAYTELLASHGIAISMSRAGNPYDNAFAESFMKTLKYEEVNLCEYQLMEDARESIVHFIEQVYNAKRLHSALGYVTPLEFEQRQMESTKS
jgi:transposase InsO family protein